MPFEKRGAEAAVSGDIPNDCEASGSEARGWRNI